MFCFRDKNKEFILSKSNTAGFSLVEVLVALSIFAVVVTMSVGTLIVLIDANAKAQDIQTGITNISFALDSMSREIRTGYNYYGYEAGTSITGFMAAGNSDTNDCNTLCSGIIITESGDSLTEGMGSRRIAYRINDQEGSLERMLGTSGDWTALTAPNIHIESSDSGFTVYGTDKTSLGDELSPTVTLILRGYVDLSGSVGVTQENRYNAFDIQTSVTQHTLDL